MRFRVHFTVYAVAPSLIFSGVATRLPTTTA